MSIQFTVSGSVQAIVSGLRVDRCAPQVVQPTSHFGSGRPRIGGRPFSYMATVHPSDCPTSALFGGRRSGNAVAGRVQPELDSGRLVQQHCEFCCPFSGSERSVNEHAFGADIGACRRFAGMFSAGSQTAPSAASVILHSSYCFRSSVTALSKRSVDCCRLSKAAAPAGAGGGSSRPCSSLHAGGPAGRRCFVAARKKGSGLGIFIGGE